MIKKTILVFISFFGFYSLLVFLKPSMSKTQHQWQDNVARGEKFIYDESGSIKNVIIGSSLSQRLVMDSLPDFYNLAFAGQGIFDGLEILRHKKNLPKYVFIEMNIVLRPEDQGFTSGLFSPVSYFLKKYCPPLRADKQPLSFIYPSLQNIINKKEIIKPVTANSNETEFSKKLIQLQIANYTKLPDSNLVYTQFSKLVNHISYLKNKGVNIVFFEMPLNPNLVELPLARLIRNKFYENFPITQYHYIKIPNCSEYITGDGLHLKDDEALIYTLYFKKESKTYIP